MVLACSVKTEEQIPSFCQSPASELPASTVPGMFFIKIQDDLAGPDIPDIDLSSFGNCSIVRTFPEAGRFEARHRAAGLHKWYTVSIGETATLTKAVKNLDCIPGIEFVEPVPVIKSTEYPFNDPKLPQLWGLYNNGEREQWNEGCDVNALNAWTIETGKPEVIVAVNDQGVESGHEDLFANMWVNTAELNGLSGEDDDNNGYIDDVYGYSFMTYDNTTTIGKIDPGDHGTHVAGTIAAVNNNGIGIAGVAGGNGSSNSGVRIMCTQTLDGKHGAMTPDSFVYAADNGAVLVNCSWGYVNPETPTSSALLTAFRYFNQYAGMDSDTGEQTGPMAGGLIIFAAGNEGLEVSHPAMEEEVFAVAALSANYVRSYFTSYGEWVDICAPGGDANRGTYILSTTTGNSYGNMQGSSMAAPHVTGVAALLVSYYGVGKKGFTRDKLIHLLQSTADKKALEENGSYATKLGAGLVDAYAALLAGDDVSPLPVSVFSVTAHSNTATLKWTVPGSDEVKHPYCFNLYYGKQSLAALDTDNVPEDVSVLKIYSYGAPVGTELNQDIRGLSFNTEYYFRISSESLSGLVSDLSDEVSVQTGGNNRPVITALDGVDVSVRAHETKELRFRVSDADGHDISCYLQDEKSGLSLSYDGENLATVSIDATKISEGHYEGKLCVSDTYEISELPFNYTVLPNSPPKLVSVIPDQVFTRLSETRSFSAADCFSDPDGETLAYAVSSSTVSIVVKTELSSDGSLILTSNSYGSTALTVTATDYLGASATTTFNILVKDGVSAIEAYPNPVKDYLNVRTDSKEIVNIKIISSLGSIVFLEDVESSPFSPATVDLRSIPSGVYKAVLKTEKDSRDLTLVKL